MNPVESMRQLYDELLAVEKERQQGDIGYTIEQVVAMMRAAIQEAAH